MADAEPPVPPPDAPAGPPSSPPSPPAPAWTGARCPRHPERAASVTCARCGSFVCPACVAGSPVDEPICPPCLAAYAFRAVRRPAVVIDPGPCVERAWELFKVHWPVLVLSTLVFFGIELVASIPAAVVGVASTLTSNRALYWPLLGARVVLQLAAYWLSFSLQLGVVIVWLRLLRGQPAEVQHVFRGIRYGGRGFLAFLLYSLMILVGLVLLIVPGVIVTVGFSLFPHLMVDKGLGPIEALSGSWNLTAGSRNGLFVLLLAGIGIAILGLLACCVGVLPAMALVMGLQATAYHLLTYPGNHYLRD